MPIKARYAHTNMIVNDLPKMVAFYRDVFGFTDAEPERAQSAPALEKLTGIPGASIRVQHLRYPGDTGSQGPTLEIICYTQQLPLEKPAANRPGLRCSAHREPARVQPHRLCHRSRGQYPRVAEKDAQAGHVSDGDCNFCDCNFLTGPIPSNKVASSVGAHAGPCSTLPFSGRLYT